MHKTGTSAIQTWFADREDQLARQRLLYLRTNKRKPACGYLAAHLAKGDAKGRHMLRDIKRQADDAGADIDDVVISSESFSQLGPASLAPLIKAFKNHQLFILVWLRRQDRFAEAMFKQAVKWGGNSGDHVTYVKRSLLRHLDYDGMLRQWQNTFPDVTILPQIYEEPTGTRKPDSIGAMLSVIGRPDLIPSDSHSWRMNLSPVAGLISRYNKIARDKSAILQKANRQVMREFGENAAGRGDLLSPELAASIMEYCAESNRRLHSNWFPDRPVLFHADEDGPIKPQGPDREIIDRFDQVFHDMHQIS